MVNINIRKNQIDTELISDGMATTMNNRENFCGGGE